MLAILSLATGACTQRPAGKESIVVAGDARFEFLTPSLVRMEYAPGGHFVDAPSVVVRKRNWPIVPVTVRRRAGWLTAASRDITLHYRLNSGRFTARNLEVTWSDSEGHTVTWRPGTRDPRNLGGLTYSLDNVSRANLPPAGTDVSSPVRDLIPGINVRLAPAQPGLLSRAGYSVLDDSGTPVWNPAHSWIEPREPAADQDWYLFLYGTDYQQALEEYAQLCGPIPMIPRYALGPMVTDLNFEYLPGSARARDPRLARYGERHIERQLMRLRDAHIPVDTLVLDFGWHDFGWNGGYDWSPLIARPGDFIRWLHGHGFKLSLNDHPGYANTEESNLSFADSHAERVLKDLGRPLPPRPAFDLDLERLWQFSRASHGASRPPRTGWRPIRVGESWQAQGRRGHGAGWYRAQVRVPATVPARLYLYLGGVERSYRLFVDGREVSHTQVQWPQRLTSADISRAITPGTINQILLRVEPGTHGGGLLFGPTAIRDVAPPAPIRINLARQAQARVFTHELLAPLLRQGVDLWWVDGGSGAARMAGLNPQLWTNALYSQATQRYTGGRGFILARYGGWGSERYPAFFTGDTFSQWRVLSYEVAYSARGGNVLVPYISHDIGGFHGGRIPFSLYARWIEFGAFSPLLRMHSAHENPWEGNLRMPWTYGERGVSLMRRYFTLHTELIPYLYTYAWVAHRESLPLMRPLYLEDAFSAQSYSHMHEYFLGRQLLVAPVLAASGRRTVYLPPGQWLDFFTGAHHAGGTRFSARYGVGRIPVFVPEGSLIPEQAPSAYSDAEPLDPVIVNVFGSGRGRFDLYEDDGVSRDYREGEYALTPMFYTTHAGRHRLVIGPTRGDYRGQLSERAYQVRIHTRRRPAAIAFDGHRLAPVKWRGAEHIAILTLPRRSIRERVEVTWR